MCVLSELRDWGGHEKGAKKEIKVQCMEEKCNVPGPGKTMAESAVSSGCVFTPCQLHVPASDSDLPKAGCRG